MVLLHFHGVRHDGTVVPGRILPCADRQEAAQEIAKLLNCPHLNDRGAVAVVFDVHLGATEDSPTPDAVAKARR